VAVVPFVPPRSVVAVSGGRRERGASGVVVDVGLAERRMGMLVLAVGALVGGACGGSDA
jgi:hypothetical protein